MKTTFKTRFLVLRVRVDAIWPDEHTYCLYGFDE
jgi:hypothetical protein